MPVIAGVDFLELVIKQEQRQALTPQMELSVRILQMDSLQLTEYLKEVMLENPVVDIEQVPDKTSTDRQEELALRKMEWLESQTHRQQEHMSYYDEEEDHGMDRAGAVYDEETLAEHLLAQAEIGSVRAELLPVVRLLIGDLDENGYLTATLPHLAQELDLPVQLLEEALRVVHGFEPVGVGARDLRECLCLQLAEEDHVARALVCEHLESLAKNEVARVSKALGVPSEKVVQAMALIRSLHPKPGSLFARQQMPAYITPDVVVTSFDHHYHVMLCEFAYPEIRFNKAYLQMARENTDQDVVCYINGKINQINWIKKCIESRNQTLLSVARVIVRKQERFFRYGPRYLDILRMKDVADELELHESTISRAVRDKYLQCTFGVYPLRHFFVKGVDSDTGGVSSHNIKGELKCLIESEPPEKPLSDRELAVLLSKKGMEVSRRTVAKYREELGIEKSSRRVVKLE